MQTTSQLYRALLASGAPLQARATIGGVAYTDISAPVITRALMQDRLSVGNVVSASLALAVRGAVNIPRSAAVVVEVRLNDGQTASEWLPQGTFYISRRMRDPVTGLLALECYDALLKANAVWTPSAGAWPRTMAAVTAELAALLGVTLDSRTVIPTGAAYAMSEPAEGTTIRDALGVVAQAAGGNWVMTPAGLLRLVRVGESGGTVDVTGVVGGIDVGQAGTITGVRSTVDGVVTLIGDDTGIVVDVSIAPMIAAEMAESLIGQAYAPFHLSGAIYDPAAELGDGVRAGAGGEVISALCSEQAAYGPAFRGDIAAPDPGEVTDEYPYIGSAERTLALAKAAAIEAVDRLDDALTQQEIFNRLTDDGAAQGLLLYNGQLYINASYINSGIVKAEYIDGENLHVKAANIDGVLVIGQLPSSVAETSDIPTKVSQLSNDSGFQNSSQVTTITNNTISTTNVTAQNLKVKAANIDGTLVIGQLPSDVAVDSDIPTKVSELTNDSGFQNSTQVTTITNNTISTTNVTAQNLHVKAANIDDTFTANKIVGGTLTLGGADNVNGVLQVLNANSEAVVTMNQDGATINSGSIVSYSSDGLYRSKVETGGITLEGYVASQSEPIAKWRSLLQLVNTLGQTAEGSQSYLVGAGDVNLSAGDLHTVRITGGTTARPEGRSAIEVGNSGIILTGPLYVPNMVVRSGSWQFYFMQDSNGAEVGHVRGDEAAHHIAFREITPGTNSAYEDYFLPNPTNQSGAAGYSILTTKSAVGVPQGGTGATTPAVVISNEYTSVLDVINSIANTRVFPISVQKWGNSTYNDMPTGFESWEWNMVLTGDATRCTAFLYIYGNTGVFKRDYFNGTGVGAWITGWVKVSPITPGDIGAMSLKSIPINRQTSSNANLQLIARSEGVPIALTAQTNNGVRVYAAFGNYNDNYWGAKIFDNASNPVASTTIVGTLYYA